MVPWSGLTTRTLAACPRRGGKTDRADYARTRRVWTWHRHRSRPGSQPTVTTSPEQQARVSAGQRRPPRAIDFRRPELFLTASPLVPKLNTRIRFPSSAPPQKAQVRDRILRRWAFVVSGRVAPPAIHVRSAHRYQCSRCTVFIVRPGAVVLVDEPAQPLGDPPVRITRGVLLDQRGPHVVVPHPCHQVLGRRAGSCSQMVPCVPQIVEVQTWRADLVNRLHPAGEVVEVRPSGREGMPQLSRSPGVGVDTRCLRMATRKSRRTSAASSGVPIRVVKTSRISIHFFPASARIWSCKCRCAAGTSTQRAGRASVWRDSRVLCLQ
jgi:hypothetical protein